MGSKLAKMMIMACVSQGTSGMQIWKKRNPHCSGGRDAAIDCSDGADPSKKVSIAIKEEARAPISASIFQYFWISVNKEFDGVFGRVSGVLCSNIADGEASLRSSLHRLGRARLWVRDNFSGVDHSQKTSKRE